MADIAGVADAVVRAQHRKHYPRNFSVFQCPQSCPYFILCTTEYVKGGRSDVLRETEYMRDDGYREGNVDVG